MSEKSFTIQAVDHVELHVSNKVEAVRWYKWIFGLEAETTSNKHIDSRQPEIISIGNVKLAIYEAPNTTNGMPCYGVDRIALRTNGEDFISFLQHLNELEIPLYNDIGELLKPRQPVDHGDSHSIYFIDFDCNNFEIVSYDYDYINEHMPVLM